MSTPSNNHTFRSLAGEAGTALKRFVAASLRAVGLLLFGFGLEENSDGSDSGWAEASVVLLGLVLSGTIALGVAVHEKGPVDSAFLLIYIFGSLIPLVGMTHISRASTKMRGGKLKHRFSKSLVQLTVWNTIACTILVGVSAILAKEGLFPGQEPPKPVFFSASNPTPYDSEDFPDRPALYFDVRIGEERYPEGIPSFLPLTVTLTGALKDSWEIMRTDGFKVIGGKPAKKPEYPGPYFIETNIPYRKGVFWQDLDANSEYVLRVYIFSREKQVSDERAAALTEAANGLITDGKGITVLDRPPL